MEFPVESRHFCVGKTVVGRVGRSVNLRRSKKKPPPAGGDAPRSIRGRRGPLPRGLGLRRGRPWPRRRPCLRALLRGRLAGSPSPPRAERSPVPPASLFLPLPPLPPASLPSVRVPTAESGPRRGRRRSGEEGRGSEGFVAESLGGRASRRPRASGAGPRRVGGFVTARGRGAAREGGGGQ